MTKLTALKFAVITSALALSLAACLPLGLQQMSAEQIRATDGIATCTTATSIYGKATTITLNVENQRKNSEGNTATTITPECSVIIENKTSPRFPPTPASTAPRAIILAPTEKPAP